MIYEIAGMIIYICSWAGPISIKQPGLSPYSFSVCELCLCPRDADGYPIPIGSNQEEGGNAFKVSTNEKRSIIKKAFSEPPSRNESFIWLIRTYFQEDKLTKGAVLIEILKQDPNFPDRLKPSLHEMQALWFYKIKQWDSAAPEPGIGQYN
jgi:hypothetical protein